jgi:putative hydrolase of HD superfamily
VTATADDPADRLAYLRHAYRLKERPRSGWGLRGIEDAESVADHAWGTALLCLLFADEAGVDRTEAIEIALVHDLAEAEIGDLPSLADVDARPVGPEAKARLEARAMAALAALPLGPGAELVQARWRAYEERDGAAARFVRDMNLVDMALQALAYAEAGRGPAPGALDEFVASARARTETPFAHGLLDEIVAAYAADRDAAATEDGAGSGPGVRPGRDAP